jgi:hypothetical protein
MSVLLILCVAPALCPIGCAAPFVMCILCEVILQCNRMLKYIINSYKVVPVLN